METVDPGNSKEVRLARLFLMAGLLATGIACWQTSLVAGVFPQFVRQPQNGFLAMLAFACAVLSLMAFLLMRMLAVSRQVPQFHVDEVERSLRSKGKRLTGIIESIDEVLWTFEFPGWGINYVSPSVERIYSRSPEAFYADPNLWLKSVHPADRQRVIALSRSIIETGRKAFQYRIVRPDG
ncbi:MAG: PAS domain-containing protein, partial [Noviherbaspirillum sp.]